MYHACCLRLQSYELFEIIIAVFEKPLQTALKLFSMIPASHCSRLSLDT